MDAVIRSDKGHEHNAILPPGGHRARSHVPKLLVKLDGAVYVNAFMRVLSRHRYKVSLPIGPPIL